MGLEGATSDARQRVMALVTGARERADWAAMIWKVTPRSPEGWQAFRFGGAGGSCRARCCQAVEAQQASAPCGWHRSGKGGPRHCEQSGAGVVAEFRRICPPEGRGRGIGRGKTRSEENQG